METAPHNIMIIFDINESGKMDETFDNVQTPEVLEHIGEYVQIETGMLPR